MNFLWAVANKKRMNKNPPDNSQTYGCIIKSVPALCPVSISNR